MVSLLHSRQFSLFFLILAVIEKARAGYYAPVFRPTAWQLAHATFYGDETASETMGEFRKKFGLLLNNFLYNVFSFIKDRHILAIKCHYHYLHFKFQNFFK